MLYKNKSSCLMSMSQAALVDRAHGARMHASPLVTMKEELTGIKWNTWLNFSCGDSASVCMFE